MYRAIYEAKMKKLAIVIVAVVVAVVLGFGFIKKSTSGKKFVTYKLSKGDITEMVSASGTINPISNIDVGKKRPAVGRN